MANILEDCKSKFGHRSTLQNPFGANPFEDGVTRKKGFRGKGLQKEVPQQNQDAKTTVEKALQASPDVIDLAQCAATSAPLSPPAKPMTGGCNGWTEADYAEMLFEMCAPGMHNGRPYLQNQASMYVPIKKKTVGPILLGALSFEQQRGFRAGECAGIAQRLSYMTENAGSQLVISPDLIMLRSGIWNLSDKKYCKPEPGKYIPFRVDADIVDESQIRCDSFLRFLNTASGNDRDIIRQLAFFCAYLTLVPKAGAKKIHFLGTAPNSGNLGHATAQFTLDVYGHVTQKMRQDSANRMQKFYDQITK